MGLFLTILSLLVFRRSNAFLAAYFRLARERCHLDDLAIFSVQPIVSRPARFALTMFHIVLLAVWGLLTLAYFAVTYFGFRP